MRAWATEAQTRFIGEQMIEEFFNRVKRNVDVSASTTCTPAHAMAITLDKNVLNSIRKYDVVDCQSQPLQRDDALSPRAFEPFLRNARIKWRSRDAARKPDPSSTVYRFLEYAISILCTMAISIYGYGNSQTAQNIHGPRRSCCIARRYDISYDRTSTYVNLTLVHSLVRDT